MALVEICVSDVSTAIEAWQGGADRLELCSNLWEGGTTPSYAYVEYCLKELPIPCFPLLIPRGGNYQYSKVEKKILMNDAAYFTNLGAKGLVIGALNEEGSIDIEFMTSFMSEFGALEITFHKAFDDIKNSFEALDILSELKVKRILTSGCKPTALEGKVLLKELIQKNKIQILVAGAVNENNAMEIIDFTGASEIHAGLKITDTSGSSNRIYTTREKVKALIDALKNQSSHVNQ